MVYLPYCTGDVHTGDRLAVYSDADPASPRTQFHRGLRNIEGATQWLRSQVGRPSQLLLTGFSAGGVGSTATYAVVRETLQPTGRASLLADSGPLMPAPRAGTAEQFPSLPLHNRIRTAWGLDEPNGLIGRYSTQLRTFDTNDLGSVNGALARRYPSDRFGFMLFLADGNFSSFSYEKFYPDISGAPDEATRRQRLFARWLPDAWSWAVGLYSFGNVSFHMPFFRNFNDSHCLTIVDFSGTGIEEQGIASLTPFIDNTLDRGPPMRNIETDWASDIMRPVSSALSLLSIVLGLFG